MVLTHTDCQCACTVVVKGMPKLKTQRTRSRSWFPIEAGRRSTKAKLHYAAHSTGIMMLRSQMYIPGVCRDARVWATTMWPIWARRVRTCAHAMCKSSARQRRVHFIHKLLPALNLPRMTDGFHVSIQQAERVYHRHILREPCAWQ